MISKYTKRENKNLFVRAGALILSAMLLTGQTAAAETAGTEEAAASEKEETVYVIADAAGNPQKIIVSDWLNNASGETAVTDESGLSDIENLTDDSTWSEKDDGEIEWDTEGQDVFYRGTADEDLPVTVSVTYLLDGEEVTPEEIAGKSGEVTIRYEYQNHEEREVEIEGEKTSLHVPFAVVAGMLLDENVLSNVQVTNGRVISDGDHTIAVGIAFPGIAEDLKNPAYASLTNLTDAEVPAYMEITGQAENFAWGTSYMLVTNELFSSTDVDAGSLIDKVFGKLGLLKTSVDQVMEGVSSLKDGAGELKSGSESLAEGLKELTGQNEAILSGAEQIMDSALETVKEQLTQAGVPADELTMDNYEAVLGQVAAAAEGESKEKLTAAMDQLNSLKEFYDGLTAYTDGVAQAKEGADQLHEGSKSLESGASKLLFGTTILNAAVPDLSGVPEALKESVSLGESYNNYSGIEEGVKGKVRFIWKLSGI